MSNSDALYRRAQQVTPGGVHSPVRAFHQVGGTPVFMHSARGAWLRDVDGRRYIDFCLGFGPLILGHRHPRIQAAIHRALNRGLGSGTAEAESLRLAELITRRIPWAEQVRFLNSGTEAVMTALRLARGATGRSGILKFAGCYHGHVDALLIQAGSGLAGTGQPATAGEDPGQPGAGESSSAGIPPGVVTDTLVAPLDDEQALRAIFAAHGNQIAAAIIEPLPANHGLLPQRPEFLQTLADECRKHGVLLIFDEVITGFRVAFGGYSALCGIQPDLVTWGKIIGGGLPAGALAGRRELMEQLAPTGPVYQAGTLAGNPLTMAAGIAALSQLTDGSVYASLETLGQQLDTAFADAPGWRLQRAGSLFWPCATDPATPPVIRSPAQIPAGHAERYPALFHRLLDQGLYLAPSPCEVGFLCTAHTPRQVRQLARAITD
jgi:glutamate-1-semialdehyde 2,1-aminomutase